MKKLVFLSLLVLSGCAKEDNTELIDSYTSQITFLNSQISSLQNQVNNISGLEATIENLNSQISELENNVNSLTNQNNTIPGLEETISQLNSQISELQSTINLLSNDANIIPSNFTLSSNYIAPDTFYNIKLNWDINENPLINSINIYKGDSPDNLTLYKIVYELNGEYTDTQVSVRKNYYYSLSYNYLEVESDKTIVKSIEPFEPLNNEAPPECSAPCHIHNFSQFFDNQNFESIKHKFTIHEEPSNEAKMYYSMFYGTINDSINFYYGIQTDVLKLGSSPPWGGRGLIFSRWQTRDTLNYSLADGGWGQSAGYEGDFIGVRRSYEWTVGTYETEIKRDSTDNIGDWYSLKIRKLPDNNQFYIGSIRFESSSLSEGIKPYGTGFLEIFGNIPSKEIPDWHVSMDDITVDEFRKPSAIRTKYVSEPESFSNIYTTNNKNFHSIIGPNVKKITPGKYFIWNDD